MASTVEDRNRPESILEVTAGDAKTLWSIPRKHSMHRLSGALQLDSEHSKPVCTVQTRADIVYWRAVTSWWRERDK